MKKIVYILNSIALLTGFSLLIPGIIYYSSTFWENYYHIATDLQQDLNVLGLSLLLVGIVFIVLSIITFLVLGFKSITKKYSNFNK
ncbi:MAG: hypothetical protein HRS57_02070 [Mycoplasmataceae bacterium]|nr:hypothetical protein [Mycoplasmataceae bacterium]